MSPRAAAAIAYAATVDLALLRSCSSHRRLCGGLIAALAVTAVAGAQTVRDHFLPSQNCAVCHAVAPGASAMRNATGDDVSPHGLWQATMMANSFRDPYFRAQMERESAADPAVQELCLRCHTPMAHHTAVEQGKAPPRLADVVSDPLAADGVSCTMCHQITDQGLGDARTFSGRPVLGKERQIFGPFPDPAVGPMRMHVNYTPTQGLHVRKSALCGTCHTLETEHAGIAFAEQTPYLEWRNSEFSDEDGASETSRTCQECHMARTGSTRIARNPMGRDFLIPVREGYAAHSFVGGNAFVLDLLRVHRQELEVDASVDELARMAAATRQQLAERTATIAIDGANRDGGTLAFAVRVENHTGHKFPTGYPARRAWLHVQVRSGRETVFESGAFDDDGRIGKVGTELGIPHVTLVEGPDQVPIYELVAQDSDGQPTTSLVHMVGRLKDSRILPRGYRRSGPHAEATEPVGTESDLDFVAGSDTVAYRVPLPAKATGRLQIIAWLQYQTIPPAWVDSLRHEEGEAARRFVRLYDGADKSPETIGVASAVVDAAPR